MSEPHVFPHQEGDTVSTAIRFSTQMVYQKAVDEQKAKLYLTYDFNDQGTACSFKLTDYTELLLIWQPSNQGYATDCQIKYVYLKKTVPGLVIKYYAHIAGKRYRGVESIDKSLPGVNDAVNESRRVVFQDTEKLLITELDGFIINPPYPPFAPHTGGKKKYSLLAAVAVAIGIGMLARRLTRRPI